MLENTEIGILCDRGLLRTDNTLTEILVNEFPDCHDAREERPDLMKFAAE